AFFFQAEDGIRDRNVTGVQTCALPIYDIELPDLPVLPFSSAVKSGRDGAADFTVIDKGTFILSDAIDIYKHANSFMIIKVTGDILEEWLEWGASQFTSNKDENILYPNCSQSDFDGYNFNMFPAPE